MSQWWKVGRKIVAIGRNYRDHAKEMNAPVPTEPFWFLKPTTSYIAQGGNIVIPDGIDDIHHEVELGVIIGTKASKITDSEAMKCVAGYCLAFDMTARTWQSAAKKKGLPWTTSKGFDTACPHGPFIPASQIKDINALTLWCSVNGEQKQRGSTSEMIFQIPQLISTVSRIHTLEEGDLLLTGTPEGVGPVRRGDTLTGGIEELGVEISFAVK
eukprot:CAMPEP_0196731460 /NCGR_PEP_ID=MMETSP1091-20130531/11184_1 /TAXON_ID=302021 /ORGANISM="Rhodomonas sp., Strain CCMP768" /LENGTH=212 /DNA_ID=CAMNT_0042074599 /DNA_START=6 /DNA_END=644 /DNA_ORIENTATION=+